MVNKIHTPASAAEELMETYSFKTMRDNKTIYIYIPESGIYQDGGEAIIEEETQGIFGEDTTNYNVREVVGIIKRSTGIDRDQFDSSKNLTNVKNGILNLKTRELTPHSSWHLFLNQVPVNYNPEAQCPAITKFFSEVVSETHQKLLRQIIGYLLVNHYHYRHQFIFVGSGHNGKTTLLQLLEAFIDKRNIVALTMQELCGNTFTSAQLYGKKANLCDELGKANIKEYEKLKQVTGGSTITAQRKHQHPFEFNNIAKMIFACNEIPNAVNADDAYFDRCVIIPFENVFIDGDNADEYLLDKLTTDNELSGLLNIALDGLQTIREDRRLDFTNDRREIKRLYRLYQSGDLPKYARARIIKDTNSYVSKVKLYNDYCKFQEEVEEVSVNENVFHPELKKLLSLTEGHKSIDNKLQRVWLGIKLGKYTGYTGF